MGTNLRKALAMGADGVALGELIRRLRVSSGLSQEQLAGRSGLSVRAVSDLERGQRSMPRPETIRMLADGMELGQDDRHELFIAARPELRTSVNPRTSGHPIGCSLPAPHTHLIGRDREVAGLISQVTRGEHRLTTLTGPGGVGKTRLALEVASQAAPDFADGVVFVDLSPIAVQNQVMSTIAQALGVQESGEQAIRESVLTSLRNRQLLILLDNFEQVIDAAALVGDLLAGAPELRVMVTSREALRIREESEFFVEPLELPAQQETATVEQLLTAAAIELFVAAAAAVNPGFMLSEENADSVAGICRRVDGLPLAIELAASRIRHFPPAVLLERLGDTLPVLTGGARDLPDRQKTLRDTIAWSYNLLNSDEQALFRRVGVFPGGASLAALDTYEAVAGSLKIDLLSGLASLVDKSLLRERIGADGLPRFAMLETIRDFANEMVIQSGEVEASRRAVVAWAVEFVSSGNGAHLAWFLGRANLQQVGEEIDNVRLGFEIATELGGAEPAARIFLGSTGYFYLRGLFQEAVSMATRVLELAESVELPNQLRGNTLGLLAGLWNAVYDPAEAERLARDGLTLLEREFGDGIETLDALTVLVMAIRDQGRYEEALAIAESANALASAPGAEAHRPWTTFAIGKLSYLMGDQDRAIEFLSEAMRLSLEYGANDFAVHSGNFLAAAYLRRGDLVEAAAELRHVVQLSRDAGSIGAGGFLDEAAVLATAGHFPETAAMLYAANSAQNELFGMRERTILGRLNREMRCVRSSETKHSNRRAAPVANSVSKAPFHWC